MLTANHKSLTSGHRGDFQQIELTSILNCMCVPVVSMYVLLVQSSSSSSIERNRDINVTSYYKGKGQSDFEPGHGGPGINDAERIVNCRSKCSRSSVQNTIRCRLCPYNWDSYCAIKMCLLNPLLKQQDDISHHQLQLWLLQAKCGLLLWQSFQFVTT